MLTSRDEVVNQVKTVVMNELYKLGLFCVALRPRLHYRLLTLCPAAY